MQSRSPKSSLYRGPFWAATCSLAPRASAAVAVSRPQTIYDDANDKLEFSEVLSAKSKVSTSSGRFPGGFLNHQMRHSYDS